MSKLIRNSNWGAGLIIFFMPVLLIFFLGSQMAYGQVKSRFEVYQTIPELTLLTELEKVPAGQVVMLRGRISPISPDPSTNTVASDLIIFQERPADGREVRFQEEFPLVFPEFIMGLPDGPVVVSPSQSRERVIQHELHTVTAGDRKRTGFRPGDVVTIQGQWQPGSQPVLVDVTGISGGDKASLMEEWQSAFKQVSWVRNGLGLLSLLSIILLVIQLRRTKTQPEVNGEQEWHPVTTETVPTASPQ